MPTCDWAIAASVNTNEALGKANTEETTVADRRHGDAPKLHTDAHSRSRRPAAQPAATADVRGSNRLGRRAFQTRNALSSCRA